MEKVKMSIGRGRNELEIEKRRENGILEGAPLSRGLERDKERGTLRPLESL